MNNNTIVTAIYSHPELYPPTLNCVISLSEINNIIIVHRGHVQSNWDYPDNIQLKRSGNLIDVKNQETSSVHKKIVYFMNFTWDLWKTIKREKPSILILYDSIPLFSYFLIRWVLGCKPFIWYHNHDVAELSQLRKYSIGWFAAKFESKTFRHINLFTLPSIERKKYFPLNRLKGKFIFLPNLPSKVFFAKFEKKERLPSDPLRLLYQGVICEGHGLESIIAILSNPVCGKTLELHLAGRISKDYQKQLEELSLKHGVNSQVVFHGLIPYKNLPYTTSSCDIGVAIHEPKEIIYQTGGTASNKIYEYAACGLPILYYENEHYSYHLGKWPWAIPTNLTEKSILQSIEKIYTEYTKLSQMAKDDFMRVLNFEEHFILVKNYLTNNSSLTHLNIIHEN